MNFVSKPWPEGLIGCEQIYTFNHFMGKLGHAIFYENFVDQHQKSGYQRPPTDGLSALP